jgi:DNA-binding response OmpR family regulator
MAKAKVKEILIVEDDESMQDMYRMIFERRDEYKIRIEGSAETALRKVRENDYDLIILDIVMWPMTGDSFFVSVRSEKKTKNTPILIVSILSKYTLEQLEKINHCDFLQKPVSPAQVIDKVEKMLK